MMTALFVTLHLRGVYAVKDIQFGCYPIACQVKRLDKTAIHPLNVKELNMLPVSFSEKSMTMKGSLEYTMSADKLATGPLVPVDAT